MTFTMQEGQGNVIRLAWFAAYCWPPIEYASVFTHSDRDQEDQEKDGEIIIVN